MAFNKLQKYQKHFRKLVQLEREEEMRWHLREIMTYSPEKREKLGRAILDLTGKDAGRGLGGVYLVKLGRRKRFSKTDISVGDLVILSKRRPKGDEQQATVVEMSGNYLVVAYNQRPPGFVYADSVRVDLFSNDITFQRMQEAIIMLAKNQKMQAILLEKKRYREDEIKEIDFANKNLNESQQEAVRKTLKNPDFHLIHGPPGTGKTTTLVESIVQHVKLRYHVMASADSNIAVDNMVEKLVNFGVSVVRVGNPARITPALISHTLDYIITENPHYQATLKMAGEIDELRDAQKEHKPANARTMRGHSDAQLKALARRGRPARGLSLPEINSMSRWISLQEEINQRRENIKEQTRKAVLQVLKKADVICCTNSTAGSEVIGDYLDNVKKDFDVIFVDEASQSVEPSCLIPITRSGKFIMSGDHKQLPPTILNQEAQVPLQFTLFQRLLERYGDEVRTMLSIQYRMHEKIMQFSNEQFYNEKLIAHNSVAAHTLDDLKPEWKALRHAPEIIQQALAPGLPSVFIDTAGMRDNFENQRPGSTSYGNPAEAELIEKLVETLTSCGIAFPHIGIISPYDEQVSRLRDRYEDAEGLEIKSVDGFQGREKEVIIISFVRSNEREEIGFLSDLRRLNVAITRAKRKLIMIGNSKTLSSNNCYKMLVEQMKEEGGYLDAGKFEN